MHTTSLRKVGGSVMLAVPPALLDVLKLTAGAKVGIAVNDGRLIVEPTSRPHYTLDDLIAQCDSTAPTITEDREWMKSPPVGNEIL